MIENPSRKTAIAELRDGTFLSLRVNSSVRKRGRSAKPRMF